MAGSAEALQAFDLGRQGQAGPLGPHHQQHGQIQCIRHLPGAGRGAGTTQAIVKAHGSLTDGGTVARRAAGVEAVHRLRGGKE